MNIYDNLKEDIICAINKDTNINCLDLVNIIKNYKEKGLEQKLTYEVLEIIRNMFSDSFIEDTILDVMDVVCSFCIPELRIWNN